MRYYFYPKARTLPALRQEVFTELDYVWSFVNSQEDYNAAKLSILEDAIAYAVTHNIAEKGAALIVLWEGLE
jgi:hypothetical protein